MGQTQYYLFVSRPLSFDEDMENSDEGMIGKILHAARVNHKEVKAKIQEGQDEIKAQIKDAHAKIDSI